MKIWDGLLVCFRMSDRCPSTRRYAHKAFSADAMTVDTEQFTVVLFGQSRFVGSSDNCLTPPATELRAKELRATGEGKRGGQPFPRATLTEASPVFFFFEEKEEEKNPLLFLLFLPPVRISSTAFAISPCVNPADFRAETLISPS